MGRHIQDGTQHIQFLQPQENLCRSYRRRALCPGAGERRQTNDPDNNHLIHSINAFFCCKISIHHHVPVTAHPHCPTRNTALQNSNFPFSQKLRNSGSSAIYTISPRPRSCTPKITPSFNFSLALLPAKPLT